MRGQLAPTKLSGPLVRPSTRRLPSVCFQHFVTFHCYVIVISLFLRRKTFPLCSLAKPDSFPPLNDIIHEYDLIRNHSNCSHTVKRERPSPHPSPLRHKPTPFSRGTSGSGWFAVTAFLALECPILTESLRIWQKPSTRGPLSPPPILDGVEKSLFCFLTHSGAGPRSEKQPWEVVYWPVCYWQRGEKKKTFSCSSFYSGLTGLVQFQTWVWASMGNKSFLCQGLA